MLWYTLLTHSEHRKKEIKTRCKRWKGEERKEKDETMQTQRGLQMAHLELILGGRFRLLLLLRFRFDLDIAVLVAVPSTEIFTHTSLDHGGDDLEGNLGRSESGGLAHVIVARADFDDIGADDVELLDAAQDADEFTRGPAAGFGSACARGGAGVEHVDVHGEVDRLLGVETDTVNELLSHTGRAQVIDIVGVDAHEALLRPRVGVVAIIGAGETRPDAAVSGGSVGNQTLGAGDVEETTMVEARLVREPVRSVADGVPCIEMGVEMQHRDGFLVDLVQGAQGR